MYNENDDALALKQYLNANPDSLAGLAALITAQNYDAIADLLNDETKQKSVAVGTITMSAMVGAIMQGSDYQAHGTAIGEAIQPMVSSGTSFDFDEPDAVAGMEAALQPYAGCLAKFEALKTTKGSIAEHLFGQGTNLNGAQIHNALNVPG